MRIYANLFDKIICPENLFLAWDEFKKGKRSRPDVELFEHELEKNIFNLHHELRNMTYEHGEYKGFYIADPKLRHIHKALVRDRIFHHAVFSVLNSLFERSFIATSYSCRVGKGTHKGVKKVSEMLNQVSRNNTRTCYALKCDVRKFFDNIDHEILLSILSKRINDEKTIELLKKLIGSYESGGILRERERERERVWRFAPKAYPSGISLPNFSPTCI
jgi:retron-type reverse transcriptase